MLASIATFALEGVDSREVTVEVDVRRGLPAFTVVGLPDASVREARERVRSALLNSGLDFPLQRITANLAPASVRKAGPSFDLALAVAVLVAGGQVPAEPLGGTAVCGELSLSGALRPVRGMLASALAARACGYARVIVPEPNAAEAVLADGLEILPVPDMAHAGRAPSRALGPGAGHGRIARRRTRTRPARTWPRSGASTTRSADSRSPPRAATTS